MCLFISLASMYILCFEISVGNDSSNMFIVKEIKCYNKSSKAKYILVNDYKYRIILYDDVNKYNINDTLVLGKFSK